MALPTTSVSNASVNSALLDAPDHPPCYSHLPVDSRWRSGPPPLAPQMKTSPAGVCATKALTHARQGSASARTSPRIGEPENRQANALNVGVQDQECGRGTAVPEEADRGPTPTAASEVVESSAAKRSASIFFEMEAATLARCLMRVCEEDRASLLEAIASASRVYRQSTPAECGPPLAS